MRVLVTRPEPSAQRTAAELRRRGHQPVLLPLMQARHQLDPLRKALLHPFDALIVTSSEAIRALASLESDLSAIDTLPLFAVGPTTAEAAGTMGFRNIITGGGDGDALASRILAEQAVGAGLRFLYLAGSPRSPALESRLLQAGVKLSIAECYGMVPVTHDAEAVIHSLEPLPVVLLYSAETARHFLSLTSAIENPGQLHDLRFLCLSKKIADTLPAIFLPKAAWPVEPREDLLLDLI